PWKNIQHGKVFENAQKLRAVMRAPSLLVGGVSKALADAGTALLPGELPSQQAVGDRGIDLSPVRFHERPHCLAELLLRIAVARKERVYELFRLLARCLFREVLLDDIDLGLKLVDLGGLTEL